MNRLLLLLAPLPLLSGCFLVAAGAAGTAGYVVSQQVSNHVHTAQVSFDVDDVWPSVKETMGFLQEPGSEATVQDFPRVVNGRVDGAKVRVEVEALDLDMTTIRVTADKYMTKDNATAKEVLDQLLRRLDRSTLAPETTATPASAAK
ncbi:MAG TPA: hypothetical protein VF530_22040 [Planctomycetota bacterium]